MERLRSGRLVWSQQPPDPMLPAIIEAGLPYAPKPRRRRDGGRRGRSRTHAMADADGVRGELPRLEARRLRDVLTTPTARIGSDYGANVNRLSPQSARE